MAGSWKGAVRIVIPDEMQQWLLEYEHMVWAAGLLSLGFLIVGVILLPLVVVRLPEDYLVRGTRSFRERFAVMGTGGRIYLTLKNLLGALLVLAGLVMLITPGQGLVSIAVGLGLIDLRQKQRFMRLLAGRKGVLRRINRFRARFGRPPLQAPE